MKAIIRKRLSLIILMTMLFFLLFHYAIQTRAVRRDMLQTSQALFWQIEQILEQNAAESAQVVRDFKAACLVRAKAAAYMIQSNPGIIGDQEEMEKVANLLEIDEFHLFDPDGNLYAGSQPKYFGLNFNSGEQMQFFLPMLSDRSLELCQDIAPNTAEQKLMQYAAVWREDGAGIVQIGMEPSRVLEAKKKNELSYIFSLLTADSGAAIYAIDPVSNQILGSTKQQHVGKRISEIGIDPQKIIPGQSVRAVVDGVESYCAFSISDATILARTRTIESLYQNINRDSLLLALYLLLAAAVAVFAISKCLDLYIINGISDVNRKLLSITDGDLDATVEVDTTPEFVELSRHINLMVTSLLDVTNKMSAILALVRVPIGVYEYSHGMKRVLATSRISDVLGLTGEEAERILSDYTLFEELLAEIRRCPADQEREIYELPGGTGRYVRLESFVRERHILGIVIDMTEDMMEKRRIEHERDVDQLTGLYTRRAFYQRAEKLFLDPPQLGHAALLMIDADHLKQVNDRHGHQNGDRYLQGVSEILQSCRAEQKLLARLSGDEFVLLLYGLHDRNALTALIGALHRTMADFTVELSDRSRIPVSFSTGCAFYPDDSQELSALLKLADERMYEQKKLAKRSRLP